MQKVLLKTAKIVCLIGAFISIWGISLKQPCYVNFESLELEKTGNLSKNEIVLAVNNLFGNPKYNLKFCNLSAGIGGQYSFVSNTIFINKNVENQELPFILAHELCHKLYSTSSEKIASTHALKILLNSENTYLKNSAKMQILYQKSGYCNPASPYYICNFLVNV